MSTLASPSAQLAQASAFIDEVIDVWSEQEGAEAISAEARDEAVAAVEAAMQRLARAVEVAA